MRSAFVVEEPQPTALRALNYCPDVERFRRGRTRLKSVPLGSLLAEMGPAYGSVFTRRDCAPESGVELLSQTDMFAAEPMGRVIRRDSMPDPGKHLVKRGQILIAGAGTLGETELFGRSILADARLAGKYVGPHAMVLGFHEPECATSLLAYAFLCSSVGRRAIRSACYGTKVLGLRRDILKDLPVPLPDTDVQDRIAQLIRTAVGKRELYLAEIQATRRPIELLPEIREATTMCSERRARCVAWRGPFTTLCARTFAGTGGALGYLSRRWSGRLGDVVSDDGLFNGPRFQRVPCLPPHGVPFMSQRDVFLVRALPRQIVDPGFSREKLFVPSGSLLVGGHGTLGEGELFGRAVYVSGAQARSAFTQDLLRIQPNAQHAALVYGFLSTTLGLRLLRTTGVGTKLLSMRLDLLRALPIPDASKNLTATVSEHLTAACEARAIADDAENAAIRLVEQEVLPAWLA